MSDAIDDLRRSVQDLLASHERMAAQLEAAREKLVPPGTIVPFAGPSDRVPSGWKVCDGAALDRNDPLYRTLFEVIGYVHGGAGDTFHLPDYRGRFLRGVDAGAGRDPDARTRAAPGPNETGQRGDGVGSVQGDAFGSHTHHIHAPPLGHTVTGNNSAWRIDTDDGPSWNNINQPITAANSGSAETRPKNASVAYLIRL